MITNKRYTLIAMAALYAAALTGGCDRNRDAEEAGAEAGTVNFLMEAMPTNLDPRIGADAFSAHVDGLIFSSLLAHDDKMDIVPDLADRWETPDPLTYIFHLRHGVNFHDGRMLTSADVEFTFNSILNGSVKTPKRGSFRMVETVETPDDWTIVFHLREPYASFLWNLTRPGVGIVPRGSGPELAQHPIGTGPFRFVSMTTDQEIVLERNPNYFGGVPAEATDDPASFLKPGTLSNDNENKGDVQNFRPSAPVRRMRLRIVPDAIVRALELRKGTADAEINSLTPDMVAALGKYPSVVADEEPGTTLTYIAFNFDDPILAHREVRQALAFATDRATLIRYLLRGNARPASSLLPPNHWAYNGNVKQYDYDPKHAEQLLDAAGFPRGAKGVRFHLELKTSTEESTRLYAAAIADEWKRVGVALDMRPLEFATFYSDITRGSFQLYTQRWVGGNNDPDMFEYVFSSKKVPPDGANRGHYRNTTLDSLLDQANGEMSREKREAILAEIQKIVAEDQPYINLWYLDNECVHRDRLTGIALPPAGDYEFLAGARLQ